MNRDVFIIHAGQDEAFAASIVRFLEDRGIRGWLPSRDFANEEDERAATNAALSAARIFIIVFSAAANASRAVQNEVQRALESNKLIVPFRIGVAAPTGSLELVMTRRYSINALAPPLETHLEELVRIIKPFANQRAARAQEASISRTLPARAAIVGEASSPTMGRESMGAFQVAIKCPRVAEAGASAMVELVVGNRGQNLLGQVEIEMRGANVAEPRKETVPDFFPGTQVQFSLPFTPLREGSCLLRFFIRGYDSTTRFAYSCKHALKISLSGEVTIVGDRLRLELPESMEMTRASMTFPRPGTEAQDPSISLPDGFEQLDAMLESAHSLDAESIASTRTELRIPFAFLGHSQPGSLLVLEPVDETAAVPRQEMRLSARPRFTLGRSREEADYLLWFWPRNEIHDAKTLRISKSQCTLVLENNRARVQSSTTSSATLFDEMPLSPNGTPLGPGGLLNVAAIYLLEVNAQAPVQPALPQVSNLASWKGPLSDPVPTVHGCATFKPVTPNVLPQRSVWIWTEASFGRTAGNALVMDIPELAEIQGRFHFFHGCFWIENCNGNGAVRVNDFALESGHIVPLTEGKMVQLGNRRFRPRVTA
jgi:hypothetical protein